MPPARYANAPILQISNTYHPIGGRAVHARHQGAAGVEACHFECVVDALNMVADYRPESKEQIIEWALEGFEQFMSLEQDMFARVNEETQIFVKQLVREPALV